MQPGTDPALPGTPLAEMFARDLEPIRRRYAAATGGTWSNSDWSITKYVDGSTRTGATVSTENVTNESAWDIANCPGGDTPPEHGRARQAHADAQFIAHAHEDIPALIRDVETGRRAVTTLRAEIEMVQSAFRTVDDRLDQSYADNAALTSDNVRLRAVITGVRNLAAAAATEDNDAQRKLLARLGGVFAEHMWTVADDLGIPAGPCDGPTVDILSVSTDDGYMQVTDVLRDYRPGSHDWGWEEEFDDIRRRDPQKIADLTEDIRMGGICDPILLGDDGRVWDGHHRLLIATIVGISDVAYERGHTAE